MKYNPNAASGVEVIFERQIDVQTVREAFRENAERLKSLGNDSSISDYQKWVAQWTGDSQVYKAPGISRLIDPLTRFVESTEEKVDELLEKGVPHIKLIKAGKRYKLGNNAELILEQLDMDSSGEAISG